MSQRRPARSLQKAETVYALLREGQPRHIARKVAGISGDTWTRWLNDAEDDFGEQVERAEADAIAARYRQLAQHFDESWQATAWWLERRAPDDYSKTDRAEVKHTGRVQVQIVSKLAAVLDVTAADVTEPAS